MQPIQCAIGCDLYFCGSPRIIKGNAISICRHERPVTIRFLERLTNVLNIEFMRKVFPSMRCFSIMIRENIASIIEAWDEGGKPEGSLRFVIAELGP